MNLLPPGTVPGAEQFVVGARPEHLSFSDTGVLSGKVRLVESLGHERLVLVDVAGELITVRLAADAAYPAEGADVRLGPTGPVHFFDPASGARLER
jgi:ABC-type sugar transport system ATPase subunit